MIMVRVPPWTSLEGSTRGCTVEISLSDVVIRLRQALCTHKASANYQRQDEAHHPDYPP